MVMYNTFFSDNTCFTETIVETAEEMETEAETTLSLEVETAGLSGDSRMNS